MFQNIAQGAVASTLQPADASPSPGYEVVRHMLFGSPGAVRATISLLHKLNYAEPNDWSKPVKTGRSQEVMSILTKRVQC